MSNTTNESYNMDVKWIPDFLRWRYFGTFCPAHGKALSKFCTTCQGPLCPQCVKGIDQDHLGHGIVQISRYESKELAVKSSVMSNYIRCHDIQPYISNRTPVMVLHPLLSLDTGSSSSSGERNRSSVRVKKKCGPCGNKLVSDDQSVRFCSIYCKVTAYAHSSDGSMPTLFVAPEIEPMVIDNVAADGNDNIYGGGEEEEDGEKAKEAGQGVKEQPEEEEKQSSHRRRSRKGTPHRAPFF